MNNKMFTRLAKNNIKKNKSVYYPFLLAAITMIALFYMMLSINYQVKDNHSFYGGDSITMVLGFGVYVCAFFSVIVIFYTNSFLMKQRGKELGLYSILGMEKAHIGKVLLCETAGIGAVSIVGGLFFGVLCSRLMFLVLLKLMKMKSNVPFSISGKAMGFTALLFFCVFIAIIIFNRIKLIKIKPIDLLHSSNQGEKEPKAKWIVALIGVICLGIGYWIASTTKNPLEAMNLFFVAVLLVIVGTYCIFISGSIVILKLLKKKKSFYYHKTHFITVSGMIYRMKQNAIGLATICILSTAVLVVGSSTVSLYAGIDDIMSTAFPKDVLFSVKETQKKPVDKQKNS